MASILDLLYAKIANRKRFFTRGWGDLATLQAVVGNYTPPVNGEPEVEIEWEEELRERRFTIKRGWFDSPARGIDLPAGCERAYVEWIMPADSSLHTPMAIHFAATGDEGFSRRRVAFALPLLRMGVGSILLENPYYGKRRGAGQDGKFLPYVSDLWKMGRAAAEEGLAISKWLRKRGYARQVACGVSMGGHMAAKVANFSSAPMGCVAFIAPHSAEAVYLQGILAQYVAWDVLERQSQGGVPAKDFFRAVLARTDIRLTPPRHPTKNAVIIGALKDAYVPHESVILLKQHWPEARLKWVPGGHVSAFVLHRKELLKGVQEVLKEMDR